MEAQTPSEVVRQCFAAFHAKDRERVDALLSADLVFSSPRDDRIDKTQYFERCWPNAGKIRGFVIEKLFEQGNEVFARYVAERISDGVRFRNTEFMRVVDGKIVEVQVYFGRDLASAEA